MALQTHCRSCLIVTATRAVLLALIKVATSSDGTVGRVVQPSSQTSSLQNVMGT